MDDACIFSFEDAKNWSSFVGKSQTAACKAQYSNELAKCFAIEEAKTWSWSRTQMEAQAKAQFA